MGISCTFLDLAPLGIICTILFPLSFVQRGRGRLAWIVALVIALVVEIGFMLSPSMKDMYPFGPRSRSLLAAYVAGDSRNSVIPWLVLALVEIVAVCTRCCTLYDVVLGFIGGVLIFLTLREKLDVIGYAI